VSTVEKIRIAFVDDDRLENARFNQRIRNLKNADAFSAVSYESADSYALDLDKGIVFDIAILDIHFDNSSKFDGIDLTRLTRSALPDALILVRSSDMTVVKRALQAGADDYLDKMGSDEDLYSRLPVIYAAKFQQQQNPSNIRRYSFPVIGDSMREIGLRVPRIIASAIRSVHVHGESGTGKELVAAMFQEASKTGPFIKVNCAAISPSLLESELFGHKKGAYTGAINDKKGFIEAADGGWLFLDEIAELQLPAQAALLRVLETGEYNRLGESDSIRRSRIRIITATHCDLRQMVKEGKFRNDLWQRLCEVELQLKPLRQRTGEIRELAEHFATNIEGGPYTLTSPAMAVIASHNWNNGNIRELRNCIRSMTEHHVDRTLTPRSIPERIWKALELPEVSLAPTPLDSSTRVLKIAIDDANMDVKQLSDRALLAYMRSEFQRTGKRSMRQWSKDLDISRNVLSPKLKGLLEAGLISKEELLQLTDLNI
jgi:DNA-binding NtrC family response regulator